MAGEPEEYKGVAEHSVTPAVETKSKEVPKKKQKGLIYRTFCAIFGSRNDDFERRLERISKEEAVLLSRIRRRSQGSYRWKRNLVMCSVLLEFIAVGYAILTTRSVEDWKKRTVRILPVFILLALSSIAYSALVSYINLCDRKDQKTLEKLRVERQRKIDELKEKTNYYITQQLIQRYDTDPAAKAAAATVLASKLGADSGLKVYVGDDPNLNTAVGKSSDVELVQTSGLQSRKQPLARSNSTGSAVLHRSDEAFPQQLGAQSADHNQPVFVDHYEGQGSTAYGGGWLARIAALLVGEDPTQCYALICGNCHMHNGLASKEDFPYVTYICPHCHAVNGPRQRDEHVSGANTPTMGSSMTVNNGNADTPNVVSSMTVDNGNKISNALDSPSDKAHDNIKEVASPVAAEGSREMVASADHAT
ncbi:hypothetical protein Ancab_013674 [Ancistrocladus abbreviatus]